MPARAKTRRFLTILPAAIFLTLASILLSACTQPAATTPVKPSPSPTAPHIFTVLTSQALTTVDPAVATGDTDVLVGTSVYQRLMRVVASTGELKPDAATDCLFSSRTVYECTLPENLSFHNGNPLTSDDVRFSIQRALRLGAEDTGVSMFDALQQIQTPDAHTIRFQLSFPDNQFGYALSTLAASIVDEDSFDPDSALPLQDPPTGGSGPLEVESVVEGEVILSRFERYVGPLPAGLPLMRVALTKDSPSAEAAMASGEADVIWRTLDDAALQRLATAGDTATPPARTYARVPLPGKRVTRLAWNPASTHRTDATLRQAVAKALQQDRTLDSLVPLGVPGRQPSFPMGGQPKLPAVKGHRVTLTLGYDPSAPGHADLARLLRDRIEAIDGVSVRVQASAKTDLSLSDRLPWVNNASGWLQPYVDHPLDNSADFIAEEDQNVRTHTDAQRDQALTALQRRAALDLTVLPVSQGDGILVVAQGVTLAPDAFGSGGELGLWSIRHE